ncbi:ATP phosphoribosyltransferase regulatory subunit [Lentibacillus halodurans]|uniref:ATP phosphoribosyltransferase regulatory subunit n=1 Tax=Lentibacillus halodurans TaxID=237679 RepID=A0A1I0XVQ6_9BACI|nr:ATP phosphoribosyltransferase regulatory subunit [Lentibacillus halodurans]SFB05071.1 ATP phosphoribosyltransferase regulatory subunit [Lentibacillus halodurans]
MQPFFHVIGNDLSQFDFQLQNSLTATIKNRFYTYGYQETKTSTFQDYDLYSSIIGTVHKQDMIKTIDPSGDVIVLRPDVTIPITRKMVSEEESCRRLFYVQEVFRQPGDENHHKEFTQAGVECFGEDTPENDAEMIAMAVHILKDLKFSQFKIEVSHAGFFKELIDELPLSGEESEQLQKLIKSKNLTEIEPFLQNLSVEKPVVKAVKSLPMLYGSPQDVIENAASIALNEKMQQTIEYLKQVYKVLTAYGVENAIVFDLGLINHMNYYSGVIFQGYVASYSKPVLMGGRYNDLATQFGQSLPAIGFGCVIDYLLDAGIAAGHLTQTDTLAELVMYYEQSQINSALSAANRLRDAGYQVMTLNFEDSRNNSIPSIFTVHFEKERSLLFHQQQQMEFQDIDELENLLKTEMRDN